MISIVTPSYNQASFLEETMKSVLDSGYKDLEYILMDGGSTDGSVEIIERFSDRLAYWQSEKDSGQYDAIQKGFERSTGEIMGWLNSDDMYFPWTLKLVGDLFSQFPEVEWITTLRPVLWSTSGLPYHIGQRDAYCKRYFLKGLYLSDDQNPKHRCIQQESTFWRRSLWEKAGGRFSETEALAGDFELWSRFFQFAPLVGVDMPLGGFRYHGNQRSVLHKGRYHSECLSVLNRVGGAVESGISAKVRDVQLGRYWPFRLAPSLGFIQPTQVLRFHALKNTWELLHEWIFD